MQKGHHKPHRHHRDDDKFWGTVSALLVIGIVVGITYWLLTSLNAHIQ